MREALRRQPWETKEGLPEQHLVCVRTDASLLTSPDVHKLFRNLTILSQLKRCK